MTSTSHLLTAVKATARLGVSRQTFYAYVSRGLVRAVPVPGDPRRSAYDARHITALLVAAAGYDPELEQEASHLCSR